MFPSGQSASGNLYVLVELTVLLYKDGPEFLHPSWHQQSADAPEFFHLGLGETTWNLPAAEGVVSW
jgi:hypothetical protein